MEKLIKKYHKLLLMSNLKITIPNPCSANWDKMKNLDQGRFCEQCEK